MFRTRIKDDIICEFLLPQKPSNDVIILCDGMPSVPSKKHVAQFYSKKGFWVFHPRYRGTWESDGEFLKQSPVQDIIDVIDQLPQGFKSIWDNRHYSVKPSKLIIMGSSFGGTTAILTSQDKRVTHSIAFSPVIDWTVESEEEPLDWLFGIVKDSFGQGYRLTQENWNKLSSGKFFNPINHTDELQHKNIFIIATEDDKVIPASTIKEFHTKTSCQLKLLKTGGHLSLSRSTDFGNWRRIKKFINK